MIERAFGLATDLYELTMAAAYFENDLHQRATFELFVRTLPKARSYLVVAGVEQALEYMREFCFTSEQIDYLRHHPSFKSVSAEFFDYLAEFKFTGDVWAVPEGRTAFAMEPLLRVTAPIIEAQLVETFLLSTVNFQTMIASKAARVVTAARGRNVIEFGTRRAHGSEAGLLAARAAYIGGCAGTSNVEAGYLFGIPTFGTLAHSFIMSFDDEDDAFRAFLKVFPDTATILVDTYDTLAAIRRLSRSGYKIHAFRLDSGDLLDLSVQARQILDEAGMTDTKIFASGDLNERRVAELLSDGARIDVFGVGTDLATSFDMPALGGVYKMVESERGGKMVLRVKLSPQKATYPGAKQVWRQTGTDGHYSRDLISLADEPSPGDDWESLLEQVMKDGARADEKLWSNKGNSPSGDAVKAVRNRRLVRLNQARGRAAEELRRLPQELLSLDSRAQHSVAFSERLASERQRLREQIAARQ